MAARLGTPLMPWQRYVADVILEIDPATGELAYQEWGLTVPRQSGKTTLILALAVHRALGFGPPAGPRQTILYAAQTRNDARRKWKKEHVFALEHSVYRRHMSVREANGSEAILWSNGSEHGITSTTEKAAHGDVLDLGLLDEAFSQPDDRVEQAFKPAMVTRRNAQFGWLSTAGTKDSLYLLGKVETGRNLVEAGVNRGTAYFEWSADPEADPADPATWRSCMPAFGITVRPPAVANFQLTMKPAEYRRAFLNIADTEASEAWQVIEEAAWMEAADARSTVLDPVAFAVDATPDRRWASIGVAGRRPDGLRHLELVEHRPGLNWAADWLIERVPKWRPCAVVVDPGGPAGSLIARLEEAGIEVLKPTIRDAAQGCGSLYDGVCGEDPAARDVRYRPRAELTAAAAGAVKRPLGDGGWAWARTGTSVDISPLVAVTLAAQGHAMRAHLHSNYDPLKNLW